MNIKRKSSSENKSFVINDWKLDMDRYINIYNYLISLKKTMEDSKAFTKSYIYFVIFYKIEAVKNEIWSLFPFEKHVYMNDSQKMLCVDSYLEEYGKMVKRVKKMKDYVWDIEHPINNPLGYTFYGKPF